MEGIILSSWDYIMGPQIEMLWLAESETNIRTFRVPVNILKDFNISKHCKNATDSLNFSASHFDMKTYSTMCGQLLLGEVDTLKPCNEWSSRFYITEHKILIAVIFRMDSWFYCGTAKEMKDVSLCLGVIFKRDAICFALDHRCVIDIQLRKAVDILLKSMEPEAFPVNHLSVLVEELVALINVLCESNLRCLQFQMHASLGNALPSDIISKAVVSHLQTSCYSVVIGGSEFVINQVLRILSLVSSKRESSSSLSVTQLSSQSYIRGLYIQGAIKDVEKGVQCLLDKAYEESSPLTIIDTDLFKVWQTIAVSENAEKEKNSPSVVTETGCLVPDLINDILSFEKYQGDCTSLIQGFTRSLMMKATSLVKIVYHFRECGKLLSKSDLMTMCGLRTFEDLHVLLGYAEKIKPGISSYLL